MASSLSNINADTIRRAEEAVGKLADQYRGWVRSDIEKLRECLAAAKAGGNARDDAYKRIRAIAHDMRGQGTTFGYPLVTRVAKSISQTLKDLPVDGDADAALLAHVDAVEAIIGRDAADAAAGDIVVTLETAIGRTLD
jgi:hypothetical protein